MRLKNKKTGEIIEKYPGRFVVNSGEQIRQYDSLAELNADWEDAPEEPKGYWSYDTFDNDVTFNRIANEDDRKADQEIGNYFNTREEAEQAVEKLKAWKRLKDKGITFEAKVIDRKWYIAPKANPSQRTFDEAHDTHKDLMIIFGGK